MILPSDVPFLIVVVLTLVVSVIMCRVIHNRYQPRFHPLLAASINAFNGKANATDRSHGQAWRFHFHA